ncbi:MgtC/SapB family protein [Paenibacillus sp. y28]|uniref:MgtC/SapB family protein n=1 Tax=Paenibacillus sp. y28 TaxID=3129110 RepID=UPI003016BB46
MAWFDSADVWHISYVELIVRMILATVLGGMVGIEREWSNHAAGFRTHILVCLGSATIMLLSIYGFSEFVNESQVRVDPARLAAQVISGIGFLGAGAILRNGNVIKGLTTAASVWVVAAIGLCTGAGFYTGAFICTFFVLVSLYVLNKWERHMLRHRRACDVDIVIRDEPGALGRIASIFGEQGIQISNLKMNPAESPSSEEPLPSLMTLTFRLRMQRQDKLMAALEQISSLNTVISMETQDMVLAKNG